MTQTYRNDLFERAVRGETTPRPPIWLMRQAGRTDPEYLSLKAESAMTLGDLFRHPELAARISLLPRRLGVDAIIYFQDILTPLGPMGAEFEFAPGPVLDAPIRSIGQIERLREYDPATELPFIPEIFRLIRRELSGELPVLGFCGAPFTLAVFMIEGGSFGDDASLTLDFAHREPKTFHALLDKLTRVMITYMQLQADAGAAAVQLFESAADLLTPALYREFALPYQQRIIKALKGRVPTIMFARNWADLDTLDASGADVLSLPSSISIADARARLGGDCVVQGNLSNRLLAEGTPDEIASAALACIESGERRGHIFNLDHGLLRTTPYENVQHLVRVVRDCAVS